MFVYLLWFVWGLKMIENINIQNYQSHENTDMDFDPGVNVIIGLSDTGKSAIIRALKWVFFNRPLGDAYRSKWGGDTSVTLSINNNKITRERSKKDGNVYKLNSMVFKAMSTGVPDEIVDAVKINALNLQSQIDPHFLFSNTPGEVASHINQITGLHKIDTGLHNLKKGLDSFNKKEIIQKEDIEKFENERDILAPVIPIMEADILLADKLNNEVNQKKEKITTLERIIKNAEKTQNGINEYNWIGDVEKSISGFDKKINKFKNIREKINRLYICLRHIEKNNNRVEQIMIDLKKDEQEFNKLMPETCPLCGQDV